MTTKKVTTEGLKPEPKPKRSWGGSREKVVVDELMTRQVASLLATGATSVKIAQDLGVSRNVVARIAGMDSTRALVKEIGDSAIAGAKAEIRLATAGMVRKIMDVINQNLDEGNLDAVKVGLKILGFQDNEPVNQGAATLQVIMPGAAVPESPKTFEVTNNDSQD